MSIRSRRTDRAARPSAPLRTLRPSLAWVVAGLALGAAGVAAPVAEGAASTPASTPTNQGCSRPLAPGLHTVALTDQGRRRPFLLFVPKGYDGHRRLPVVFDLHGSGSNGLEQLQLSKMRAVANAHGFAVAAPSGAVEVLPQRFAWNVPGVPLVSGQPVPKGTPSDTKYLLAVRATTQATICVDAKRVYFTGVSGGARMISTMACRFPRRIAAIAPVAGLRAGTPVKRNGRWVPRRSTCRPARPVPVVTFHGTSDAVNPYAGNEDPRWGYSTRVALARWATLDGCSAHPTTRRASSSVDRIRYRHCGDGSNVVLYRERGAGHTWPGSTFLPQIGKIDHTISASRLMWAFFNRHPRR